MGRTVEMLATGVITLAIISVIVSRNAQTAGVLQALGSAISGILGTVVSPVTGSASSTSGVSAPSGVVVPK